MTLSIIGRCSEQHPHLVIPFFLSRVSAGFPSPAQDYIEQNLDLNQLCIQHPSATYFVRVEGLSMIEAGIAPNDILIVDRALQAEHGDIIIAALDGELTVKELATSPRLQLLPHNPAFSPIIVSEDSDFEAFGVVTNVIHNTRQRLR